MTVFGIVCVLVSVIAIWRLYDNNTQEVKKVTFSVAMTGCLAVIVGTFMIWWSTLGQLASDTHGVGRSLKVNQIYETVSSTRTADGRYAVILRQQDGCLRAYLLDLDPPKRFKRTSDEEAPYWNYP